MEQNELPKVQKRTSNIIKCVYTKSKKDHNIKKKKSKKDQSSNNCGMAVSFCTRNWWMAIGNHDFGTKHKTTFHSLTKFLLYFLFPTKKNP